MAGVSEPAAGEAPGARGASAGKDRGAADASGASACGASPRPRPRAARAGAVTVSAGPGLATIRRRLAALGYEALLLTAMLFVAGFVFLPFLPHDPTRQTLTVPSTLARVIMSCVLAGGAGVYYVWCWSNGRRTLPQKTWRLRLVDRRGAPPTRARALVRYVACWLGPALALAA